MLLKIRSIYYEEKICFIIDRIHSGISLHMFQRPQSNNSIRIHYFNRTNCTRTSRKRNGLAFRCFAGRLGAGIYQRWWQVFVLFGVRTVCQNSDNILNRKIPFAMSPFRLDILIVSFLFSFFHLKLLSDRRVTLWRKHPLRTAHFYRDVWFVIYFYLYLPVSKSNMNGGSASYPYNKDYIRNEDKDVETIPHVQFA